MWQHRDRRACRQAAGGAEVEMGAGAQGGAGRSGRAGLQVQVCGAVAGGGKEKPREPVPRRSQSRALTPRLLD